MSGEPVLMDVPDALCGRRIVVRPYQPQDTPAILAGVSASRADLEHRLRSKKGFDSPDDARRLVARSRARWILREDFIAGIFAPPAGAFCGGISLHPVDWDHGKFEIGYWLCVEARGKGYATEAVRLMTRLAFARLGAQRVEIVVECDNAPSCRVAERAHFLREGTLRRHLAAPDGTLRDVHVYSLIREDYERLPARQGQVPGEGGMSGAGAWRQPEPSSAAPPPAPGAGAMRRHGPDILFLDSAADLAPEQLDGFFSGWRRPVTAREHLRLLRTSDAVVVAVDPAAPRVAGFVAALSDGVLCAHITVLEVLPAYRGRGIGRTMVRRLLERLGDLYAVDAVCDPDLLPFYARCGLTPAAAAVRRCYADRSGGARAAQGK